jgi:hypothetical protein
LKEIAMKIASAALQLESSHVKLQHHEISESLRAWIGDRRPNFEGRPSLQSSPHPPDPVRISEAGKSAQSAEANAIQQGMDAAENDPILSLLRAMIFMLTGREVKVFNPADLQPQSPAAEIQAPDSPAKPTQAPAQQNAGYGLEYDRHESYTESEQTRFAASGVIQTADGREISFSLSLSMARSYHEESDISIRLGDARKKQDPLVLNFNGTAAQLSSQRFKFDLNADGATEDINFVMNGSGFLALDRNDDGKVNDGTELFGAASGDGFAELTVLDADQNGWIDENDAGYDQLRVWTKDNSGKDQLATLRQANVGALNLGRVETPFDLKDSSNALQGQIRSTGIFLQEDGKAGTMQQIDLTV